MMRRYDCSPTVLRVLVAGFVQLTASASAQPIEVRDLCKVIEARTAANTEVCLTNRSPKPIDHSYVMIARNSSRYHVFLLRSDLTAGGSCRPASGAFSSFRCIEYTFETPPDFDAICTFPDVGHLDCVSGEGRKGWYYNNASNFVTSGPGGVQHGPTERFFVAARGLEAGDVSAEELGDTLVYRGESSSDGIPLRLRRGTNATLTLQVREPAAENTALKAALDRATAKGVKLEDIRALGTEGRFIAETDGILSFYGTATDCEGQCERRPLLSQADFESRLTSLGAAVPIERLVGQDLVKVRAQLIDRLLLGSAPLPEIDAGIEAMRIVQPVAFLILNWS